MRPLKVLFAPYYPAIPYQDLLIDALRPHQIEVECIEALGVERPTIEPVLRSFNPDILHLHWLHPYFARTHRLGAWLGATRFLREVEDARRAGTKIVWTAHNLTNHEGAYPRLDRSVTQRVVRGADATIAHGPSARDKIIAFCGPEVAGSCVQIPMGHYGSYYADSCDRVEARRRLDIAPDAFVLLFVGRVRPYKGVNELIEAFSQADLGHGSLLLIAGKAHGERERVRLKRRCKKAPRVRLDYGYVENDRLCEYLRAADACVLPYRDILTSSAALLAAQFQTPVIAPRIGCITDLLDEESALLFDPNDEHGLRGALLRAWRERPTLAAVGARGHDRTRPWSWKRAGEETAALYRRLTPV